MKTIKFSCPSCGQHIEADASVTRSGIQCPSCQTGFIPKAKWQPPKFPVARIVVGIMIVAILAAFAALAFGGAAEQDLAGPLLWFAIGGAVGAALGEKKKQMTSGLFWGAFLGPVGWIVVYFLPDRGPKCPDCLAPVDPAARKCRHCGSELNAVKAAREGKPEKQQEML